MVTAARVRGPLHEESLAGALDYLVRRHEPLRTRLVSRPSGLVQVIDATGTWPLTRSTLDPAQDETPIIERILDEESSRPFDLARGPLVRGRLISISDQEHILMMTIHHAVTDNWSYGVLLRDLAMAYLALSEGREPALPSLPLQFADVAAWQRQALESGALDEHAQYWRRVLSELPPPPVLTDRDRPLDTDDAAEETASTSAFELAPELTDELQALARQEGGTLFMVLMAAFGAIIAEHTESRDLAIYFPTAGRDRLETAELIGFFVNPLIVRADLTGNPSFRELLARIRGQTVDAYAHQAVPLNPLRREVASEQKRVELGFNLLNAPMPPPVLRDVQLEPLSEDRAFIHVPERPEAGVADLSLIMLEDARRLRGVWLHAVDRVGPRLVGRIVGQWRHLLELVAADPDRRIEELGRILRDQQRTPAGRVSE